MKRVFNLQKNVKEVTLTINYDDYVNLMASIENLKKKYKDDYLVECLKEVKDIIEGIKPEYIWDEI